ncbi:MAG: quinoprotein relay system zinc metallohydrolase 2 [Geminicoccaceae bacterium]|nr:quinoprotein relay system zinc metallohydrolase 2 [Geminicoccaceae bacterium]
MRSAGVRRREVLLGSVALAAPRPSAAEPLPLVAIAPGLFVHAGVHEDFAPSNRGGIANLAVLLGEEAVAVVDAGGSPAQARDLLAAIRARTDRPIRHLILTHHHPDHVMGAGVFRAVGARIWGHARLEAALRDRFAVYRAAMERLLGPAIAGAEAVPIEETVAIGKPRRIDLGGRPLELVAWPTAHTDCDLTVFDLGTDTLLAGDLLFSRRMPVIDGSLPGWLAVMDELARIPAARVVPGHGPVSAPWPEALGPQRRYLEELAAAVRRAIRAGRSLPALLADPPPAGDWLLSEDNHPRNITAAYKELEWE